MLRSRCRRLVVLGLVSALLPGRLLSLSNGECYLFLRSLLLATMRTLVVSLLYSFISFIQERILSKERRDVIS